MGMRRVVVSATTDGSGDATVYSPPVSGEIIGVSYVKPGAASYSDGVDFVVTNETTGQIIWDEDNVNATAHRAPRPPVHTQVGVAGVYAAAGEGVLVPIAIAQSRIKIVVAAGGAAKVGAFHFHIKN
jgi:hypothetical protein